MYCMSVINRTVDPQRIQTKRSVHNGLATLDDHVSITHPTISPSDHHPYSLWLFVHLLPPHSNHHTPSIHRLIHHSIQPSYNPSVRPSVYPFIHPSHHPSNTPIIH